MSRNKLSAGVYEKWMGKVEYKNGAASHIMRLAMLLFAVFLKLLSSDSQPDKYKEKAPAGELPGLSRGV